MKKIFLLLVIALSFTSCIDGDGLMEEFIENEREHLERYKDIKRISNDPKVINYVDSIKKDFLDEAYEVEIQLEQAEGLFTSYDKSQIEIKNYIKYCEGI